MAFVESFLMRPTILAISGLAVMGVTIWMGLPKQEVHSQTAQDLTVALATVSTTAIPATTLPLQDDKQAAQLAYQRRADDISKSKLTQADIQYQNALQAAVCLQALAHKKQNPAQIAPAVRIAALSTRTQEDTHYQDEVEYRMCAAIKTIDKNAIRFMMQQAANAGQMHAQLYLLKEDADAAGLLSPVEEDPAASRAVVTAEERAKRDAIVSSLQALVNAGHQDAFLILSDVKMQLANETGDYATPYALTVLAELDWSKALPSSELDASLEFVPEKHRAEVLELLHKIHSQCCSKSLKEDRYLQALEALGSPSPDLRQKKNNLQDIFRVQRS